MKLSSLLVFGALVAANAQNSLADGKPGAPRVLKAQSCATNEDCTIPETCKLKPDGSDGRCAQACTDGGDECAEGEACRTKGDSSNGWCAKGKAAKKPKKPKKPKKGTKGGKGSKMPSTAPSVEPTSV